MGKFWQSMKLYIVGAVFILGAAIWLAVEYDRPGLAAQLPLLAHGIALMSRETYRG